jgi:hypothetical protein
MDSTSGSRFKLEKVEQQDPLRRPIKAGGPAAWENDPATWFKDLELRSNPMVDDFPTGKPLCSVCKAISFYDIAKLGKDYYHHKSFSALESSAPHCPLCALVYNSIQRRGAFAADSDSPIRLKRVNRPPEEGGPARMIGIKALYYWTDPEQEMKAKTNGKDIPIISRSYMTEVSGRKGILQVEGLMLSLFANPSK